MKKAWQKLFMRKGKAERAISPSLPVVLARLAGFAVSLLEPSSNVFAPLFSSPCGEAHAFCCAPIGTLIKSFCPTFFKKWAYPLAYP
ncbi:MAG: hypothetical protein RR295_04985, partial [Oscillospiraceae bacterium]